MTWSNLLRLLVLLAKPKLCPWCIVNGDHSLECLYEPFNTYQTRRTLQVVTWCTCVVWHMSYVMKWTSAQGQSTATLLQYSIGNWIILIQDSYFYLLYWINIFKNVALNWNCILFQTGGQNLINLLSTLKKISEDRQPVQ